MYDRLHYNHHCILQQTILILSSPLSIPKLCHQSCPSIRTRTACSRWQLKQREPPRICSTNLPSQEQEGWGWGDRRLRNQAACPLPLWRRAEAVLPTFNRYSQGRKKCSVISFKRISVCTASYEEQVWKPNIKIFNIRYWEAFLFVHPTLFLVEAQKK